METGGLKLHSASWDGQLRWCSQRSWAAQQMIDKWPCQQRKAKACLGWLDPMCASKFVSRLSWFGVPLGILDASLLGNFCFQKCSEIITCFTERCYRNCTKAIRRSFTEGVGGCPASSHPCRAMPSSRVSAEHKLHSCHWFLCWLLQELALKTISI